LGCGVQLPAELEDFLGEFKPKKKRTWILKPDSGCQGKGIVLVQVDTHLPIPVVPSHSHERMKNAGDEQEQEQERLGHTTRHDG